MSEHSIRQIAGGADGEDIYCACGTVVHNPPHDEFMSAYTQHVETQVREQVARELQVGLVVALREASYDENEWLIGGLSRVAYAQESEIDIFNLGSIDIGMIALYAARIARGGDLS